MKMSSPDGNFRMRRYTVKLFIRGDVELMGATELNHRGHKNQPIAHRSSMDNN